MKKVLAFYSFSLAIFTLFFGFSFCSAENNVIVTPTIFDRKAEVRDLLEFSVKIENKGTSKVSLYPLVNDVLVEEGKQEEFDFYTADEKTSLAKWTGISRGKIELFPGEEVEIPFTVQVYTGALPGKYHATITFSPGSSGIDARENALKFNQPQIMLNIEVIEHIVEKAQIKKFKAEKSFFLSFPVSFSLEVENIGNRDIKPEGFVYIYNRNGEEVGFTPINQASAVVASGQSGLFNIDWLAEKGLGQYKAMVTVEYGDKTRKDFQDTVYFWILPWKFLTFLFGGLGMIFFAGVTLLKTKKPLPVPVASRPIKKREINNPIDLKSLRK